MVKRQIIKIDEELCTGCGQCIPNCPEGALQIIDDKARIVSDLFCDGLGACIGHCPEGAFSIEEREAEEYDERRVMENVVKQGKNVVKAHLKHLKNHNQIEYLQQAIMYLRENNIDIPHLGQSSPCGHGHGDIKEIHTCPGSAMMDFREDSKQVESSHTGACGPKQKSQLRQWPVQLKLVPIQAPYLKDADLLVAADCVPFTYANFHEDFLKGKIMVIGCPKLDDIEFYQKKLTEILKHNDIKSVTLVNMEVPCCFGMQHALENAIKDSGKVIPFRQTIITIRGDKQ